MRMKRATLQNEKKKKSINAEIETEKSAKKQFRIAPWQRIIPSSHREKQRK